MAKLHEILAVEGGLDATQRKIVEEARETFGKRADHFIASHRALEMFDVNAAGQNAEDHKAMVTTVADKLDYVASTVTRYLDVLLQKEATNQHAQADIELDGTILAAKVPVGMLLGLESRLGVMRDMYLAIPTLAPGRHWQTDPATGRGVYLDSHPDVKMKTQKTAQHKILVDATKEHPAQVEKWFEDVPVGKITATTWSGMLSPAEKSDILERLDRLMRAVKRARMRANNVDVVPGKIGRRLFDYIHAGKAGGT